ncbi:hypothetical protein QMN07_18810 [Leptospira santarosai]|uniref:hypothetical protein n=1 Tax=Leptospira santarosai TaxID=28183 RepID=UPI0024AF6ECB|nr:hypothetical protein [Leptospira santarosai]MDI7219537.1 hypothetical protein [Leptospira santarosai]
MKTAHMDMAPFFDIDQFSKYFGEYIDEYFDKRDENFYEMYSFLQDKRNEETLTKWLIDDYLTILNFEIFNRKTFFISGQLAENLVFTDYNVTGEFLKPPFNCFLLVLNDELTKQLLCNIVKIVVKEYEDPINIFVTKVGEGENFLLKFHIRFGEIQLERALLVKSEIKISEIIKTDWEKLFNTNEFETKKQSSLEEESSFFYESGFEFFRILINSILYLTSSGADIVERKKIKSRKKRKGAKRNENQTYNTKSYDYYEVGNTIGSIFIDYNKSNIINNANSIKTAFKLTIRSVVRGHWRNQPFGQGKEQRKLIFIKPYYKGPDLAELVNKPYVVK